MLIILVISIPYSNNKSMAPKNPHCSPIAANIKSVWISGTWVPAYPGETSGSKDGLVPTTPPDPIPIKDWFNWYPWADVSVSGFIKAVILAFWWGNINPEFHKTTTPISNAENPPIIIRLSNPAINNIPKTIKKQTIVIPISGWIRIKLTGIIQ